MQNQSSPNAPPHQPSRATAIRDLQGAGVCPQGRQPYRRHSSPSQGRWASEDHDRSLGRRSSTGGRRSLQRTKRQRASSSRRDVRAQSTQEVGSRGRRSRTMSQAALIETTAFDAMSSNVSKFLFYYNISSRPCEFENDACQRVL